MGYQQRSEILQQLIYSDDTFLLNHSFYVLTSLHLELKVKYLHKPRLCGSKKEGSQAEYLPSSSFSRVLFRYANDLGSSPCLETISIRWFRAYWEMEKFVQFKNSVFWAHFISTNVYRYIKSISSKIYISILENSSTEYTFLCHTLGGISCIVKYDKF